MKENDTMDSLDLLVSEKALLSLAFELWEAETTGDPTRRGMETKFIIRHLSIREAARDDVAELRDSVGEVLVLRPLQTSTSTRDEVGSVSCRA